MLAEIDAALARRDPAVPGLATVLDGDAVAALTAGLALHPLGPARATHVRYKPGTSCVVGYELPTAGGPRLVFAKAHAPHLSAKLDKTKEKADRAAPHRPGVVTIPASGLLVAVAADDRDLPALAALADDDRRPVLLRRLLPGRPDLWEGAPRALRHKPERRWVGVVESDGAPVALVKAYRPLDLPRARSAASVLAGGPGAPLGTSTRRAALALGWVSGRPLDQALAAGCRPDLHEVGAVLARLHATPPPRWLGPPGARDTTAALPAAVRAVAAVFPELAGRTERLADRITAVLGAGPAPPLRVVHGDLSADQVVLTPAGARLIDLDQAARAEPGVDVASFAAGLDLAEVEGWLRFGAAAELTAELRAGYRAAGGVALGPRLRALHAGALLRLVVTPFRARHTAWDRLGHTVLDRAEAALGGADRHLR